jgi:predicted short-subunit dehydrogenase-like oxidoreductase (DUF2520 family)
LTVRVRILGSGRAGGSLADALGATPVDAELWSRASPLAPAARGVDLLVLAVPDDSIAPVARAVEPVETTVVAHLAGSRTLDVLDPHPRRASIHPLASLPDRATGARRLLDQCSFAVAGDPLAHSIVEALGGHAFEVADADRGAYHAAACVAANHVVALLAQVERVAATAGLPLDAFEGLIDGVVASVRAIGPTAAITGPASRGDRGTVETHLRALLPAERSLYLECALAAADLKDHRSALEGLTIDPH